MTLCTVCIVFVRRSFTAQLPFSWCWQPHLPLYVQSEKHSSACIRRANLNVEVIILLAMNSTAFKVPVHVEIAVKASCSLRTEAVIAAVSDWIRRKCAIFQNGSIAIDDEIAHIADSLLVADLASGKCVSFWQAELCLHPYRLSAQGPENDFMEGEEELPAAEQWELPNALLNNLWSSIVIDSVLKTRLLSYCSSSIRFSEAKIDTDIISWNRMILLHGPPGTVFECKRKICYSRSSYIAFSIRNGKDNNLQRTGAEDFHPELGSFQLRDPSRGELTLFVLQMVLRVRQTGDEAFRAYCGDCRGRGVHGSSADRRSGVHHGLARQRGAQQ